MYPAGPVVGALQFGLLAAVVVFGTGYGAYQLLRWGFRRRD